MISSTMRTFFHGWRPRLGCVALVVALVSMGCWIRGTVICDTVTYKYGTGYHILEFCCFGPKWHRCETDDPSINYGNDIEIEHGAIGKATGPKSADFYFTADDETIVVSHWQLLGFHFGETFWKGHRLRTKLWVIPYWFITLSLTLLSVYLILWKPRKLERGPSV